MPELSSFGEWLLGLWCWLWHKKEINYLENRNPSRETVLEAWCSKCHRLRYFQ